jgi:hypothetical protein
MPYRRAHMWLLALFPLIGLAFWSNYLGQLAHATFALHAHGITATAWLVLLTLQSWSIHAHKPVWHRTAGLATFVILPLFAAAGPLVLQDMAILWRTNADPFHGTYGARLVIADMIAGPAVVILVLHAFVQRRQVGIHAAAMLATALLVLPPIVARLLPDLPGFPHGGWAGFGGFWLAFQLANVLTIAIALWLARRRQAARAGFGFAAAATAAQMIGFETIARTDIWNRWVVLLTEIPPAPMAVAAGFVAAALLWAAWRKVPSRRHRSVRNLSAVESG